MRAPLALVVMVVASPALAQFPPPGIYACVGEDGAKLGTLGLLVAGDYQWDANGGTFTGQVASAGDSVEALTGPLGDQHWRGGFSDATGETVFVFKTDIGTVTCN
jgi:hypothetical protein